MKNISHLSMIWPLIWPFQNQRDLLRLGLATTRIYSWVINYLSEFHWFHFIRFHNATLISKNLGRSDLLYFLNIQKRKKQKTKKAKIKKLKNSEIQKFHDKICYMKTKWILFSQQEKQSYAPTTKLCWKWHVGMSWVKDKWWTLLKHYT